MFDFLEEVEEKRFSWNSIGNVKEGRKNLGEEMPVVVFRLFQYTMRDQLMQRYGEEETIDIFRKAGETAGMEFADNVLNLELELDAFIAHLREELEKMQIGILRVEEFDAQTGKAVLAVSEDIDCSGLPITGKTVCNYDEGFIAGILKKYTKKNYVVVETDCWATGSRVCRFQAHIED